MQPQWLYQHIQQESETVGKAWNPQFSLPSTLNWMQALSHEIVQEHGATASEQLNRCRLIFAPHITPLGSKISLAPVFGSLFHALTFSITLTSMTECQPCRPWTFPSAIVTWYYATYNAFRSIVAASNGSAPDNHQGLQRCLYGPNVRPKLPYPFNMIAMYERNENYTILLPNYRDALATPLEYTFNQNRSQSQGMLLSYLKGTAAWEVDKDKEQLKKKHKLNDFRTKDAREKRNQHLQKSLPEVNFLHCAFRYRGKANYRDSIFLAYGQDDSRISVAFIQSLETCAQFAFLCGLAYAEYRIGKAPVREFLTDVSYHFRGQVNATQREKLWEKIMLEFKQ